MLELQAICKHWQPYAPRHAAPRVLLQDLTLQVRPGETAALLGPAARALCSRSWPGWSRPRAGVCCLRGRTSPTPRPSDAASL